jgi:Ca2+-binding RTX toxin-like protein
LDVVTEASGEGTDLVNSSITLSLALASYNNVENLTLTGSSNINGTGSSVANGITGNSGNNSLDGGAGNDSLNGGLGNDTMVGGTGNDSYTVDSLLDVVTEASGEGTDLVNSSITLSLALASYNNVENLTLTGSSNINGTGSSVANGITGNSGNNILDAGAGNDSLFGGLGNDTLTGGLGLDRFYFNTALGSINIDTLTDFSSTQGDIISMSKAIFTGFGAATSVSADQVINGTAFENSTQRIRYDSTTGALFYDADGNGSELSQQFATISSGFINMTASRLALY